MNFYSARLLYIILVDGHSRKRNDYDDSIIVFRAKETRTRLSAGVRTGSEAGDGL